MAHSARTHPAPPPPPSAFAPFGVMQGSSLWCKAALWRAVRAGVGGAATRHPHPPHTTHTPHTLPKDFLGVHKVVWEESGKRPSLSAPCHTHPTHPLKKPPPHRPRTTPGVGRRCDRGCVRGSKTVIWHPGLEPGAWPSTFVCVGEYGRAMYYPSTNATFISTSGWQASVSNAVPIFVGCALSLFQYFVVMYTQ